MRVLVGGGGTLKVSTKWRNYTETCMFLCKILTCKPKNMCFHVVSLFSAHLYPHYIIIDKGLLAGCN